MIVRHVLVAPWLVYFWALNRMPVPELAPRKANYSSHSRTRL